VTKEFGDGDSKVTALAGIDLEVPPGELTLLVGPSGCGKTTLISIIAGLLDPTAGAVEVLGPLGRGFALAPGPALLVGGGIGAAILPWLARLRPDACVLLGFRSEAHAVCAGLVHPDATVVIEPELVTEPLARLLPGFAGTVYACGPDGMLGAVAALAAEHEVDCQLAMEAAMACGFGACHGCAVKIDGRWKRLCVEGPVVEASRAVA
jgi:NAD(P)H-flavin reductase